MRRLRPIGNPRGVPRAKSRSALPVLRRLKLVQHWQGLRAFASGTRTAVEQAQAHWKPPGVPRAQPRSALPVLRRLKLVQHWQGLRAFASGTRTGVEQAQAHWKPPGGATREVAERLARVEKTQACPALARPAGLRQWHPNGC